MRRVLLIALAMLNFVASNNATAAITLVASATPANGNPSATTPSINSTGANFVVIWVATVNGGGHNACEATITDNKSNSYTAITASANVGGQDGCWFYSANATVGAGHTFSGTNVGSNWIALFPAVFSGVATVSPYKQKNSASGASPLATGSVTPAAAGSLLVAGESSYNFLSAGTATTIDSSFTVLSSVTTSAVAPDGALAYRVQGAAAAVNPTWTFATTSSTAGASIAVFSPSSTGVPPAVY